MSAQTIKLAGKEFVIIEKSEYQRIALASGETDEMDLPPLPAPLANGNYPAVPAMRAVLARKLIKRRWSAGLTQVALARLAAIRPETLNRIEKAKVTADPETVDRIHKALTKVERRAK